jgi:N-acetylglucosaminyl-diphospho-decaprenol L-rhamnosyltransferase
MPEGRAGPLRAVGRRNDLWTAWLHRSLRVAARSTAGTLAGAGAVAPLAALHALRGVAWVARERRPLGAAIEAEVRLVEGQSS